MAGRKPCNALWDGSRMIRPRGPMDTVGPSDEFVFKWLMTAVLWTLRLKPAKFLLFPPTG